MFDLDNDVNKEALEEFRVKHKNCPKKYLGKDFFSATGGQYSFIITPTDLGPCVNIRCNVCKQERDITNDVVNMNKFNVIIYDFNSKKMVPYDIIPYLVRCYDESNDKPSTFEELKDFIIKESKYQWWSRCEYEIILSDWPNDKDREKWDVYKQITMNIDIITQIFINTINGK